MCIPELINLDFKKCEGSFSAKQGTDTLYQTTYTRDKLGRITQKQENLQGANTTVDYACNIAGRLAEVKTDGVVTKTFSYDANGNRGGGTVDEQDRLLTWQGNSYAYSKNGELKTKINQARPQATTTMCWAISLKSPCLIIRRLITSLMRKIGASVKR